MCICLSCPRICSRRLVVCWPERSGLRVLGKESADDKLSVLDILATDAHGRFLNIEMQTSLSTGLSQRLTYYVASAYVGQLHEGHQYAALRPAISICVLTQALFPASSALHLDFRLRESSSLRTRRYGATRRFGTVGVTVVPLR